MVKVDNECRPDFGKVDLKAQIMKEAISSRKVTELKQYHKFLKYLLLQRNKCYQKEYERLTQLECRIAH